MADGIVRVCPAMLAAKVMVAPNSPRLRAKASRAPTHNPGAARGRVTVKNTRSGPAPRVRATPSRRGSTFSMARRTARSASGKPTTAEARAAPFQSNARLTPAASSSGPKRPRRPNSSSSRYPVTTGGSTRGRWQSPSTSSLPRKSRRASSQPRAVAGGRVRATQARATRRDSPRTCSSSGSSIVPYSGRVVTRRGRGRTTKSWRRKIRAAAGDSRRAIAARTCGESLPATTAAG